MVLPSRSTQRMPHSLEHVAGRKPRPPSVCRQPSWLGAGAHLPQPRTLTSAGLALCRNGSTLARMCTSMRDLMSLKVGFRSDRRRRGTRQ